MEIKFVTNMKKLELIFNLLLIMLIVVESAKSNRRTNIQTITTTTVRSSVDIEMPVVEALSPRGIRVSIKHVDGMELFAFHGKVNSPIRHQESGILSRDIKQPVNGRWTFEDKSVHLRVGDIINYWIFVQVNGMGQRIDNLSSVIRELVPERQSSNRIYSTTSTPVRHQPSIGRPLQSSPSSPQSVENCGYPDCQNIRQESQPTRQGGQVTRRPQLASSTSTTRPKQNVTQLQVQVESLTELLQELTKDMDIGTQLLLTGQQPPGTNPLEAIRQLLVEKLELVDLSEKIWHAHKLDPEGILFEMSSPIDKKRILTRAKSRLSNSRYKIIDPQNKSSDSSYSEYDMDIRQSEIGTSSMDHNRRTSQRPQSTVDQNRQQSQTSYDRTSQRPQSTVDQNRQQSQPSYDRTSQGPQSSVDQNRQQSQPSYDRTSQRPQSSVDQNRQHSQPSYDRTSQRPQSSVDQNRQQSQPSYDRTSQRPQSSVDQNRQQSQPSYDRMSQRPQSSVDQNRQQSQPSYDRMSQRPQSTVDQNRQQSQPSYMENRNYPQNVNSGSITYSPEGNWRNEYTQTNDDRSHSSINSDNRKQTIDPAQYQSQTQNSENYGGQQSYTSVTSNRREQSYSDNSMNSKPQQTATYIIPEQYSSLNNNNQRINQGDTVKYQPSIQTYQQPSQNFNNAANSYDSSIYGSNGRDQQQNPSSVNYFESPPDRTLAQSISSSRSEPNREFIQRTQVNPPTSIYVHY